MWNVSERYLETVARSRRQQSYVEILHGGEVVATFYGGDVVVDGQVISNIGGKISVGRNSIRRSGTFEFVDVSGTFTPTDVGDLFAFFDTEIRVWVGVRYWDATPNEIAYGYPVDEYVPCGTFVITDAAVTYPALTLTGYDRMWLLGPFANPYHVPAGTTVDRALAGLIGNQVPPGRFAIDIPPSEHEMGELLFTEQSESASAAHEMATAAGWVLYVDPMGVFTVATESGTDDAECYTYAPGEASVMMRPKRTMEGSAAYNTVVFTTSATDIDPPCRAVAYDTNPESLTCVARVGVRPFFEASPLLRSQGQCELAAWSRLRGILGIPTTLSVPIIPNYMHEPGDVIRIQDPDQDIDENVIIDSFDLGMRAGDGPQELKCRSNVIL